MKSLVQILFKHAYFSSRLLGSLSITPAKDCARTMTNHGLWYKARSGSLTLFYDSSHAGSNRTKATVLDGRIALRFLLHLHDPYFYNYTASPSATPHKKILYFYNQPGSPALQTASLPTLPPSLVSPTNPFEQPFAILGLRLRPDLEDNYTLEFQPRSTTWQYILVGRRLQDLENPAIINTLTKESFTGPVGVELTDGRPALSFVSPAPISCSEQPGAACMLVENFDPATGRHKVVIPSLPIPDARIISRAIAGPGPPLADHSEIIIY